MIKCPECGLEIISKKTKMCPECGYPIKNIKNNPIAFFVVVLVIVAFLLGFLIGKNVSSSDEMISKASDNKDEYSEQEVETQVLVESVEEELDEEEIIYAPKQLNGKYMYNYDKFNEFEMYYEFTATGDSEGTFISHANILGTDSQEPGVYKITGNDLYLEYDNSEYYGTANFIFYKDYLIDTTGFLAGVVNDTDKTFNVSAYPFEFYDNGTVELNGNEYTYERKDDMVYINAGANTYKLLIYQGSMTNSHYIKCE